MLLLSECSEYTKSVTSTVSALPLLINGQVTSQQVQSCSFAASTLIVGGTKALLGEYPHMVINLMTAIYSS